MRSMVITGAAKGIGRRILEHAISAGYEVLAVDRDADGLARLAQDHPEVVIARVDVVDAAAVDAWAGRTFAQHAAPDVLVNNAGIARYGPLEHVSLDDWQAVVDVNLTGVFTMTQRVGREMLAQGRGSIVSIASVGSLAPSPGAGAYPSTKAAVAMLMQMAAVEWGPRGIRANCVSPGFIHGGLATEIYADPAVAEGRRSCVPLGSLGAEDDVAAAVLFLCSPQARYINGQNLVVDGGLTATAVSNGPRFSSVHSPA